MRTITITVPSNIPHCIQAEAQKLASVTVLKSKYYEDVRDVMVVTSRSGKEFGVSYDILGGPRALALLSSIQRMKDRFFD